MPLTPRQLANEDVRGGLWATRHDSGATFQALFWNFNAALPAWDDRLGANYRSALKSAAKREGATRFRQFEQAESLDSPWAGMTLQGLRWAMSVYSGQPKPPGSPMESMNAMLGRLTKMRQIQAEIVERVERGEEEMPARPPYDPPMVDPDGVVVRQFTISDDLRRELQDRITAGLAMKDQPWWQAMDNHTATAKAAKDGRNGDSRTEAAPRFFRIVNPALPWGPDNAAAVL